jgi:CBS domain-containing protein
MRISEMCTKDVVCCRPDTTALEAARLMRSRRVGDVVVVSDGEEPALERMRAHGVRRMPVVDDRGTLVGLVTLDDLLGALLADMRALLETTGRAQRREHAAPR